MTREPATVEEATAALATTAQRAAELMREETDRARGQAQQAWKEIDTVRDQVQGFKSEIEALRTSVSSRHDETEELRRSYRRAWKAVGIMAGAIVLAVGWTSAKLTWSRTELGHLNQKVSEWQANARDATAESQRIRGEVEQARIAQARAEGELRAVGYQRGGAQEAAPVPAASPAGPTTRPSLISYLSGIVAAVPHAEATPIVEPTPSTQPVSNALTGIMDAADQPIP